MLGHSFGLHHYVALLIFRTNLLKQAKPEGFFQQRKLRKTDTAREVCVGMAAHIDVLWSKMSMIRFIFLFERYPFPNRPETLVFLPIRERLQSHPCQPVISSKSLKSYNFQTRSACSATTVSLSIAWYFLSSGRSRLLVKATGCHFSCSSCWSKTPPTAVSLASVITLKGSFTSGKRRTGAMTRACFSCSIATSWSFVHQNHLYCLMPLCHSELRCRSFLPSCITLWNSLPLCITSCSSYSTFLSSLDSHFKSDI